MEKVKPGLSGIDRKDVKDIEEKLSDIHEKMNSDISEFLSMPNDGSFRFDIDKALKIYKTHISIINPFLQVVDQQENFDYAVKDYYILEIPFVDSNGAIIGSATLQSLGIDEPNTNWDILSYGDLGTTGEKQKALEILISEDKILELLKGAGIKESDVLDIKTVEVEMIYSTVLHVTTNDGEYIVPVSVSRFYQDEITQAKIATDDFIEFMAASESEKASMIHIDDITDSFGGFGTIGDPPNKESLIGSGTVILISVLAGLAIAAGIIIVSKVKNGRLMRDNTD